MRLDKIPEGGALQIEPDEFDTIKPTLDFIPGLLHDSTVAILYGPPGSGKTFLALHLLCSAALGRDVFGNRTEQRNALYIALEGEANIKVRLKAWGAQNGVDSNPIHYWLGKFSFAAEDDADVSALISYMRKHEIKFVVIDTLAMAMSGLDEISGQQVGFVIDALHRIKRATGACVVAIDHTGKNEKAGARGHSSKLGNVDSNIEIVVHNKEARTVGNKTVTVEHPVTMATPRSVVIRKQRDDEGGGAARFRFTLALHETDVLNARGKRMASLALCEAAHFRELPPEEDEAAPADLSPLQQEAAAILARLNAKLGRAGPASEPQFKRELKREQWGPANAASWRSTYRNLRPKLRIDSDGFVTGVA